jgi:hypothetical protein
VKEKNGQDLMIETGDGSGGYLKEGPGMLKAGHPREWDSGSRTRKSQRGCPNDHPMEGTNGAPKHGGPRKGHDSRPRPEWNPELLHQADSGPKGSDSGPQPERNPELPNELDSGPKGSTMCSETPNDAIAESQGLQTEAHTTATDACDDVEGGNARIDEPLGRGTRNVLGEIAREKRERKATKADDAEIPEYLWEEHLLDDSPPPWVVKERTKLRRAIGMLRAWMLRWWKNNVTSSFLWWVRQKYPQLKTIGDESLAQVRCEGTRYQWVDAVAGRDQYREWWKRRTLLAGKDLLPGADAILRASRATW